MRQRYIVTYDVCSPRRLRLVFKTMKGFGQHLQLSVFRCDLSPMALALMKGKLLQIIHSEEDQVLIVDVGPTEGRGNEAFESLGRPYVDQSSEPKVI
ncbi:MAG: CRISPR-associated endonuclease Cas2 [Myxococcota bacterium]|nr:CRISPR-associated endonuclease Cas2 [Myxococcota bacterium]